jgi:hypothetical protein
MFLDNSYYIKYLHCISPFLCNIQASYFLLLRQMKVTKEKATPIRHPFEIPCVCSAGQAAAELALRAQTVLAEIP